MKFLIRSSLSRRPLAVVFGLTVLLTAPVPVSAIIDASLQMQLGNPSGATADPNNHDHYLIVRSVEAIDYNDHKGQPNWASWDLTASDVGSSGRSDAWATDTSLPPSFYPVPTDTFGSYSGSSYDRGHMCPSADRTDTTANNELVFIMSNIIPQASAQNQGVWATFESYCRTLLSSQELLITCGPSGFGSMAFDGGHVALASNTWKVVVGVALGSGTALSRITNANPNAIRVIALEIPNTEAAGSSPWTSFVTNVYQIEKDTGYTFFTALPSNLAWVLRSKVDGQPAPSPGLASFSPGSGSAGTPISLVGTQLSFATNVTFNGTSAAFSIASTTNLIAIVPAGATSGQIVVRTLGGTATSSGSFIVGSAAKPDLAVSATHTGSFTQGDIGNTCSIVVTNAGAAASSGTVSVVDTLPTGLTATAMSGAGWSVDLPTLTCTRSDALGAGAAYSPIIVTVNVAANAPASVTNLVVVSGGGDTNAVNNTASDPTTIIAAGAPSAITGTASGIGMTVATLNGTVIPNGQPATVRFEYGTSTGYGLIAELPAPITGTTPLAVSANIAGLLAGTTYHFRVSATNVLGPTMGLDQTFATTPVGIADLMPIVAHAGDFTQGASGTYVITITNAGTAACSGTVTVTDTLPVGLTATAIGGLGWIGDLGTLTCTRSDALAAGTAYPPITLSVKVATNAPASVINQATVSGGGETNMANNAASDPTTVIPTSTGGSATTLVGWDVSGLSGGSGNFGESPLAPTTNAANLTVGGLLRGTGVGTSGTCAARAWGGNTWTDTSSATAISSDRCATFTVAANSGYTVSFASVSKFDYRHSGTGPASGLLQYRIGAAEFTNIADLSYPTNTSSGGSLSPIDLSNIPALQNVGAGTNVTFRIVNWGGTSSAGTWYIFDVANTTEPDFAVVGTVSPVISATADLAIDLTHAGDFTQGDTARTYTVTVTNDGTAATTGTVSVTNLLPVGLTATDLSGNGWTANLATLTCTRADALAPGASYPPINITVSVLASAPTSVTNTVTVSCGSDPNPSNNTASDPTTIIALAPIEAWRLQWFGTTANSGPAADTAVATSDGLPNLLKYALGLNPLEGASDPVVGDISTGYLRLTAPKNPDATDVSLHVEITPNLLSGWTTNGTTVDVNTVTLLQAHANAPVASSPAAFIRLRVSRP